MAVQNIDAQNRGTSANRPCSLLEELSIPNKLPPSSRPFAEPSGSVKDGRTRLDTGGFAVGVGLGDRGMTLAVQKRLAELNYLKPNQVTGLFDRDVTKKAVVELQKNYNSFASAHNGRKLAEDGIVGRETWAVIKNNNSACFAPEKGERPIGKPEQKPLPEPSAGSTAVGSKPTPPENIAKDLDRQKPLQQNITPAIPSATEPSAKRPPIAGQVTQPSSAQKPNTPESAAINPPATTPTANQRNDPAPKPTPIKSEESAVTAENSEILAQKVEMALRLANHTLSSSDTIITPDTRKNIEQEVQRFSSAQTDLRAGTNIEQATKIAGNSFRLYASKDEGKIEIIIDEHLQPHYLLNSSKPKYQETTRNNVSKTFVFFNGDKEQLHLVQGIPFEKTIK